MLKTRMFGVCDLKPTPFFSPKKQKASNVRESKGKSRCQGIVLKFEFLPFAALWWLKAA